MKALTRHERHRLDHATSGGNGWPAICTRPDRDQFWKPCSMLRVGVILMIA